MTTENGLWMPSRKDAINRIIHADGEVATAKLMRNTSDIAVAGEHLSIAVLAARDVGVSWQSIGDCLGMRRGAAYQRFRKRSDPMTTGNQASNTPAL